MAPQCSVIACLKNVLAQVYTGYEIKSYLYQGWGDPGTGHRQVPIPLLVAG